MSKTVIGRDLAADTQSFVLDVISDPHDEIGLMETTPRRWTVSTEVPDDASDAEHGGHS